MTHAKTRSDTGDAPSWNVVASVRRRWWVVVLVVVVAVVVAAVATAARTAKYEAAAQILVTPYTQNDPQLATIRMVRQSNDGARDLQTATQLLTSPQNSQTVSSALRGVVSQSQVDGAVRLEPQGGSNIVLVKATFTDPKLAAQVANSYATVAVAQRNKEVSDQARAQLDAIANVRTAELIPVRSQLRNLRNQGDPTVKVTQTAEVPDGTTGPSDAAVILAALVAGFVLGVGGAVLLDRGDRRVRDRAGFVTAVPVPVLVGVPPSPRGRSGIDMPAGVREAFRTLQIQLDLREHDGCRKILVTSGSSGDGKTTTVLNLAFALVSAGHRVIVIDFDLRKPDVGRQLDVTDPTSLVTTLATGEPLTAIMRPAPRLPPLRVVQVSAGPGDVAMLPILTQRMQDVLAEASDLADYVLIDTTPIGEISDALPLIDFVDDVLVVGRPGSTDQRALDAMSGLFERANVTPTGWIITGAETTSSNYVDGSGPGGIRGLFSRGSTPAGR
ncbi:polysaccharide biosynthesis tyrosine autokinase [Patulibacter minatonensis]|uniref:polysaccharide biosynthesis tyrosine autokinase n=1 Tax=Patulibacter minatonensis TaxID=298163 RepID=UPI00146FA32F|nr:CpsD/CapB family tyrosine-protein kinase [Patulibacter minatonensis]